MTKRILHVVGVMDRGGAETFLMNIYRNINRNKVQFDFITHSEKKGHYDDEIISLGGRIYHVSKFNLTSVIKYFIEWEKFFGEHREYKIIHSHIRSTASIYLKIAKKYEITTIIHSHSTFPGTGIKALIRSLLQYPLRYIGEYYFACSVKAGQWLFGEKIINNKRFKVMNNAIDSQVFSFNKEKRTAMRDDLDIKNKYVIGHVGNFTHPKNHEFLVDIFAEVCRRYKNTVLLIVGEGYLENNIREKVIKLGIADKVIFMGSRSDIPNLMQAMDIFVFPSNFEGFGIAALEAQASGLKTIISDSLPNEIQITNLVETVSLNQSAEYWANKVLNHKDNYKRKDTSEQIKRAGYDIKEQVKWLKEFYLNEK